MKKKKDNMSYYS